MQTRNSVAASLLKDAAYRLADAQSCVIHSKSHLLDDEAFVRPLLESINHSLHVYGALLCAIEQALSNGKEAITVLKRWNRTRKGE